MESSGGLGAEPPTAGCRRLSGVKGRGRSRFALLSPLIADVSF